jgi:hypothetical protein
MKTKKKEIEKLNKMIDFNLARKEPNTLEIRAYLYQILTDSFGLSKDLREDFKKEFPFLDDNVSNWDLNTISETDIKRIYGEEYLPKEIFYFKKEYNHESILQIGYKAFPQIFTRVCDVSFDKGGLIVVELYSSQIYLLFDTNGKCLYDHCNDLRLGANGKAMLRTTESCFWELMQYNGEYLERIDFFGPFDEPRDFPDITGRDIIPEMLPVGTLNKNNYDLSKTMTNEEVKMELKNHSESYHFLQKYYSDNEKLALLAVNSNLYAFTFLSERLQVDKVFVTKLITAKKENQRLYDFLNDELKADIEIVRLCITDNPGIIRNIAPVSDRELMEEALKDHVFNLEYASDDLKADKKLVLGLVRKDWRVLREVSKDLLSDSAFIAEVISCFNTNQEEENLLEEDSLLEEDQDSFPFWILKKELIDLNEVIGFLVSWYPRALKHISPASDIKIICKCFNYTSEADIPYIMDCISDDLKKTKAFWVTAVQNSLYMLKNAPLIYRQDKEIVLAAVWYDGELVEFAGESLRNDPEIYLAAISQINNRRGACDPGRILHLIPEKFRSDKGFLIKAVENYPRIFEHVTPDVRSDREFMLQIIKKTYGWILEYVAPKLQSDRQFILEAAILNRDILRWLPENFQDDKELLEMLKKEGIEPIKVLSKDDLFF